MEALLNFITENKILLIVIGVAIILLILVSIFGKVKSKKDDEKAKADENTDTADTQNSSEEVVVTEDVDASDEKVAEDAAVVEVKEENTEVPSETKAEEVAEEKPLKKAKTAKKSKAVEEVASEEPTKAVEVTLEESKAEETVDTEVVAADVLEEKTTLPGTVEVYKGKTDFYFSFRASNNILIGRSQGYTTKDACKKGVIAVMNAAKEADIRDSVKAEDEKTYKPAFGTTVFEIYADKEGKFRWRLFAKNQQNILASKGYTSKAGAKKAVQSLKKIAANYVLEDLTKAK